MLNLDKKRQTLKKLRDKGKSNFLLFLPCFIAYFFVSAYYFFALHLDMLLSDKEGNFLGIEKHGKANKYAAAAHQAHSMGNHHKSNTAKSVYRTEAKRTPRGDDYTPGGSRIKTGTRLVSAFLMVCFAFTFLPTMGVDFGLNLGVSAVDYPSEDFVSILDDLGRPTGRYYNKSLIPLAIRDQDTNVPGSGTLKTIWSSIQANAGYGSFAVNINFKGSAGAVYSPYNGVRIFVDGNAYPDETSTLFSTNTANQTVVVTLPLVNGQPDTGRHNIVVQPYYRTPVYILNDIPETAHISYSVNESGTTFSQKIVDNPAKQVYQETNQFYDYIGTDQAFDLVLDKTLGRITNVTAAYAAGRATVGWDQSDDEGIAHGGDGEGIDGYVIYRVNVDKELDRDPVYIGKVPEGTYQFVDPTLDLDDTTIYRYIVSSFKRIVSSGVPATDYTYFNESTSAEYRTSDNTQSRRDMYTETGVPTGIRGSTQNNGYRIDWSAVDLADDYEIYAYRNATDRDTAFAQIEAGNNVSGAQDPSGNYYYVDTFESGYYILRAARTNGLPATTWSAPVSFDISASETAAAPTNLSVLPNTNSVYLEWDDPNRDTDPQSTLLTQQYVITGTRGGTSHEKTINAADITQPYHLTSFDDRVRILDGESWTFTVRALKSASAVSVESNDDTTVIGNSVRAPEPTATPESGGAITITWAAIPEADYYTVSYKHNNNAADTGVSRQITQTQYRFENLTDSATNYTYTVTAYKEFYEPINLDTGGKMIASVDDASRSYPFNDLPRPASAPYAELTGTSAAVTWDPITSAKYNVVGYQIVGTAYNSTGTPTGDTITYNIPVGTTSYTHNNLQENITWKYKVAVRVTIGSGTDEYLGAYSPESNGVTVIPLALLPPTDPQAKSTVNSITVSWNASPSANVDGYVIYGGLTSGNLQRVGSSTTNSFTHSNLGIGETWYYYVKSFRNKADYTVEESARSTDLVNATTGTGGTEGIVFPPTDFRGTVKEDNTVDLTWTASKGSADGYYLYVKAGTTVSSTDYTKRYNTTKTTYLHDDPVSGDNSYVLVAYKYNTASGQYIYSEPTEIVTKKVGAGADTGSGDRLPAPLDFLVTTTDGSAELTWKAVTGAYGYRVHASGPSGSTVFDRSAVNFTHAPLLNGEKWTYYVTAITQSGTGVIEGTPTQSYTITVGETLNQPQDFTFTAGNRQIDLDWSDVTGAEGYIVYRYNQSLRQFEPIAVVTESGYSATGLTNDTEYTYMVAGYKTINGRQYLSQYSLPITAKPTTGSPTDLDRKIAIKGTAPHGMDRSDLMSAHANHGAFDGDVDIYIQTIDSSTLEIQNALSGYAGGLSSFMIYPFDITLYQAGTYIEPVLNPGYTVTITLPIPDELVRYREYIQVMHIDEGGTLENLRSSLAEIEDTWCIQFPVLSFSPFAFVIYKDAIVEAGSGTGTFGAFASNAFGQIVNFPQAMLPFGLRVKHSRRKVYRIVRIRRKR